MKSNKIKKYFYVFFIAVMALAVLSGCGNKKKAEASNMEEETIAISVETKKATPETIEQYINVSSKVKTDNEVSVIPKVGGTVKKVHYNLGEIVKAGDILFEIDDTNLRLQVQQAEAALASAQSGLKSAQASYEMTVGGNLENQMKQLQTSVDTYEIQYNDLLKKLEDTKVLYESGAVSKKDLDDLQSNVDNVKLQLDAAKESLRLNKEKIVEETKNSSQAAVSQAQAGVLQAQVSLETAQTQLGYTKVKAEIDGVISSSNVTVGSTVSSQSAAMIIVNMDKIKLSFNISDDVINRISVGSKAYITISAASDTPYEGTITNISPAANSQTMLYPVEMYIDNADHNIKPGMFASLRLVLDKKENTISIPLNAVIEKENEKFVYTVDANNIAHKTIVETGIKNDSNVEIISGVENGEQIVTKGQDFISDGSTVNIVAEN